MSRIERQVKMIAKTVPNSLRLILCLLSFLSFLPQLQSIWTNKNSKGISLCYVLLNLISATEQLAPGFYFIVGNQDSDFFVSNPRSLGDWLNLTQLVVVWLMHLALFATCMRYSPDTPKGFKYCILVFYIGFLLISIVPAIIDTLNSDKESHTKWFSALFAGVHSLLISPVVTIGAILALLFQWQNASALSIRGLAIQAIVFALVAISWITRVEFPVIDVVSFNVLRTWFQIVGWAAVDNAIYAFVQVVLLYLAMRQWKEPVDRYI